MSMSCLFGSVIEGNCIRRLVEVGEEEEEVGMSSRRQRKLNELLKPSS